MKITTSWQGGMKFELEAGENRALMDAPSPIGSGSSPSPKQILLGAICACSGIDIAARMKKNRLELKSLRIEADAAKREGSPSTFDSVLLDFFFEGSLPEELVMESVRISQSEECGVSAMIAAHCPIHYRVHLNEKMLGTGESRFFQKR